MAIIILVFYFPSNDFRIKTVTREGRVGGELFFSSVRWHTQTVFHIQDGPFNVLHLVYR